MIPRQKPSEFDRRSGSRQAKGKRAIQENIEQFEALSPMQKKGRQDKQKQKSRTSDWFHGFARKTSEIVGSPWSFALAVLIIVGWACLGPLFGFSDTWQLVINTATTIITFLMVFLIQNTQNRDARAIHLKLDELLHGVKGARNRLINLEELSDEELDKLQKEFEKVRKTAPPEKCEEPSNENEA